MKFIYLILPELVIRFLKLIFSSDYRLKNKILKRLSKEKRYIPSSIKTKYGFFYYPDIASFKNMFETIFFENIYYFGDYSNDEILIIDAGANIGLSSVYFAIKYPKAEILTFEPDPYIFSFLEKNCKTFKKITLYNKALWSDESLIDFSQEKADAGRAEMLIENKKVIKVEATRLSQYITKPVKFLKMDIEGAESIVIKEIEPVIHNIENIYIEYHSFIDNKQSLDEILSVLTRNEFRYFISDISKRNNNQFISNINYLGMDLQLHIFVKKNKKGILSKQI